MGETLANRRMPWSLRSYAEGGTSTTMGWRRLPTRTRATQVPSPPSGLALRPPPRSGFVQWASLTATTARVERPLDSRPESHARYRLLRTQPRYGSDHGERMLLYKRLD